MFLTGRAVLIAVLACMAVAACDDAPESQSSGTPAAGPSDRKAKPAGLPPEFVSAVSSGRGAGSITVHFALRETPEVGMALPVEIAVVPHLKFTLVRAQFDAPDGLLVSSGRLLEPVRDVASEQILKHKLTLQPTREGIYLISVGVETDGDEGNVTRSFSIPVIVNPAGGSAQPEGEAAPVAPAGPDPASS